MYKKIFPVSDIKKILHITNGDAFNEYFLSEFGGNAAPFREAMMDGKTVADIYSDAFIALRSAELDITPKAYRANMAVYDALQKDSYTELSLWFGKDTFCQMNLLTLLAYLEQIAYCGTVTLHYIDDETFAVVEENIPVELGAYKKLYEEILLSGQVPHDVKVLVPEAIALYFDYHSDNGALTRLVREHARESDMALLCLLLENSKEYGLSDTQGEKLIKKYRGADHP